MIPYYKSKMVKIFNGDCLLIIRDFPDNTFDSIITDPPYGLSNHEEEDVRKCLQSWLEGEEYKPDKKGFMSKTWDSWVPRPEIWKECYRVLKLGGSILVFAGTRTFDLMAIALRLAGFEYKDTIMWLYGCLSEDTEILTYNGWERYHKSIEDNPVLCYDIKNNSFEFHKPIRGFIYDNQHTAYRIKSDFTDQIVSRNHNVIIEREGELLFKFAEEVALEQKVSVPILENLSELPDSIPNLYTGTSVKKQNLLENQ